MHHICQHHDGFGLRQPGHISDEILAEVLLFLWLLEEGHIGRVVEAVELLIAGLGFKLDLAALRSLFVLDEAVSQAVLQLLHVFGLALGHLNLLLLRHESGRGHGLGGRVGRNRL